MAIQFSDNKNMLPGFTKARQLEWKRKMLVFSFFLALAAIIWLLNALSKNYTTDIKYPVTYSHFPENKVLISDVPENLELKVNAHGYALLSYKLSNRPVPINFSLSSFAMNRMVDDSTRLYLLTRYAKEQIARQLPGELQLLEVSPDSLIFQFANRVQRKMNVIPTLDFELEKDFTLVDGIIVSPESIFVSGPDIILDTLAGLRTVQKSLGVLAKSYNDKLKLLHVSRISLSHEEVKCQISLEKLTEVQVSVPVQISGMPDSIRIQMFPQEVTVTGRIGLSKYERIVPEAFWIEADYTDVLENKSRLNLKLMTLPEDLHGTNFSPQTVEYILSVK